MMASIFSPLSLPNGIILLITDELAAPADFMLHRTLSAHVKTQSKGKCLVLSVSESTDRWKAIASKANINMALHLETGSIELIDLTCELQVSIESQAPSLKTNFDRVQASLNTSSGPVLVILEDITTLEWIGFPAVDLARFARALRAACLKRGATLVIRHHIITAEEPDDLFRNLMQICGCHLEVRPLSSGRSGAVTGEVALHPGFSAVQGDFKLTPRSSALQYRLSDNGPHFFERGTSGGVL